MSESPADQFALRYDKLVGRLRMLMEGESLSIEPRTSHGKQESKPPKGAVLDRKPGRFHPDRDPLLTCFLERWNDAPNGVERLRLVAEYEVRADKRARPHLGRVAGGTLAGDTVKISPDDVLKRDARIIDEYEGLHPVEVASIESEAGGWCGEASVRSTRRLARRHPETGRLQEGMEDDRSYAASLRAEGYSLDEVARAVGRPKSTISDWLKKGKAA